MKKSQLLKERFQQLAGIKSLSEVEAFGAAGTDKRTQQVITDIIQLIKSKDIDPMDVVELINDEFKLEISGVTDYADRLANSGTDSDGRNTWGDKTGYSDEEMRQGKGKLKKYPDKDGRNVWGDKV